MTTSNFFLVNHAILRIWMNFVTHNYILRMKHACEYYTNGIVWHSYRMCEPTCDLSGITWCTGRITMTSLTKHPPKWLEIEVCEAPSFAQNRDSYVGPSSSPSWSPMSPYFEAILDPSWSQVVQVGPKLGPFCGHVGSKRRIWTMLCRCEKCANYHSPVRFLAHSARKCPPPAKAVPVEQLVHLMTSAPKYHASPLSLRADFMIQISSWQPSRASRNPAQDLCASPQRKGPLECLRRIGSCFRGGGSNGRSKMEFWNRSFGFAKSFSSHPFGGIWWHSSMIWWHSSIARPISADQLDLNSVVALFFGVIGGCHLTKEQIDRQRADICSGDNDRLWRLGILLEPVWDDGDIIIAPPKKDRTAGKLGIMGKTVLEPLFYLFLVAIIYMYNLYNYVHVYIYYYTFNIPSTSFSLISSILTFVTFV
jgi:hypothetical protein